MPKHLFPAAAEGMPIFNRRSMMTMLSGLVPVWLVGSAAMPVRDVPNENIPFSPAVPAPAAAWASLLASLAGVAALDGVASDALRLQFIGSRSRLRVEISKLVMEPMHPRYPDRMIPVEHLFASYALTDAGWRDEEIH